MTTTELYEEFDKLILKFPSQISQFPCTHQSSGGPGGGETPRTIFYYKIGNASGATNAPKILINAGIHAREWAPPDSVLTFCEELLHAYDEKRPFHTPGFIMKSKKDKDYDPDYNGPISFKSWIIPRDEVVRFVENLEIYVVPVSNPDGRDYSFVGKKTWRKNRRDVGVSCGFFNDLIGVDLNRNFDIAFKMDEYYSEDGAKAASVATVPYTDPCHWNNFQVYQGPSENSENETKNLKELMENLGITYYIDIHSYHRAFLIPWGINSTQVYDSPDPSKTYLNTSLNRSGGVGGRIYNKENDITKYREYFPDYDGFELQVKHWFLAAQMSDTVFKAAEGGGLHARQRSKYKIIPSAGLYPAVGGSSDYALTTCMIADGSGHASVVPSKFPIFSLTMEAGHESEGKFWPSRKKKQYYKVEREIHCSLRGLLAYAANVQRYGTNKIPK